jgi:hypothetical protein
MARVLILFGLVAAAFRCAKQKAQAVPHLVRMKSLKLLSLSERACGRKRLPI